METGTIEVRRGLRIAFRYYQGSASADTCMLMSHANGLCQDTWVPVIQDLHLPMARVQPHIFTWDHLSHGKSDIDKELPYSWVNLGRDTLAVVARAREIVGPLCNLVAVGHSMGGAALVHAELLRPGTFTSMLLVEPVLMLTNPPKTNLIDSAAKRRDTFDSIEAVRESYKNKRMFVKWDPRAFEAYLTGGFASTPNNTVSLCCPPWAEAEYFLRAFTGTKFGELAAPHIAFLVAGSTHNFCGVLTGELARSGAVQTLQLTTVPEGSHFLPQEEPALVARHILSCVALASRLPQSRL